MSMEKIRSDNDLKMAHESPHLEVAVEGSHSEAGDPHGLKMDAGTAHMKDEIPPSDPYSDFIAANPWRAWVLGLSVMFFFAMLGIAVTYGAKGGVSIGGSSVGFEARNSTLAGKILPMQNVKNMECINELALVADGTGSKFHQDYFDPKDDQYGRYFEYTECYSGYIDSTDDDDNSRRRHRQLEWGNYGQSNYDPDLVSIGNTYTVATGSKAGRSRVRGGPK